MRVLRSITIGIAAIISSLWTAHSQESLRSFKEIELKIREAEAQAKLAEVELAELRLQQMAAELDAQIRDRTEKEKASLQFKLADIGLRLASKHWALCRFEPVTRKLVPTTLSYIPKPEAVARYKGEYAAKKGWFWENQKHLPPDRQISEQDYINMRAVEDGPTPLMRHYQRARDASHEMLLKNPERAQGAIISGSALNFFLENCGATAIEHQILLETLRDDVEHRKLTARETAISLAPDEESARKKTEVNRSYVESLAQGMQFSREQLRDVITIRGITGGPLQSRLNATEVLVLDWPRVLDQPKYDSQRAAVERARDQALVAARNLRETERTLIPRDIRNQLTSVVDELSRAFAEDKIKYFSGPISSNEAHDYVVGDGFLKGVRDGVRRLIDVRSIEDVKPAEFPEQGRDKATVCELLAYMKRNCLRFGKAEKSGEDTYELLFDEMRRYYMDLYAIDISVKGDVDLLKEIKRRLGVVRAVSELGPEAAAKVIGQISPLQDIFGVNTEPETTGKYQ